MAMIIAGMDSLSGDGLIFSEENEDIVVKLFSPSAENNDQTGFKKQRSA